MKHKFKHTRTIYGGDIHGEFRTLIFELNRFQIKDALVIVLGDIGMGFHKPNYYVNEFNRMQKKLVKMNNHVLFFRGNHDDPSYFEGDFDKDYANITLANDYDTIEQNGVTSLVVGGAISIDRIERTLPNTYWENESNHFTDEDWDKIKDEKNISILLTHPAPIGIWPFEKPGLINWIEYDSELDDDVEQSRETIFDLYTELINNGCRITNWYYGHYHENHVEIVEGVEYRCVDKNKLYEK